MNPTSAERIVLLDLDSGATPDQLDPRDRGRFLEALGACPVDLGERQIEGLRARGCRLTDDEGTVTEVWTSDVIDQPQLSSRTVRANGQEDTRRLFNIRLGEPHPALFAVLDEP
jgi:hypothetical protein